MSKVSTKTIARIAWGLCLLVGIVLSFKAIREPDLWWMYRTGEWMIENGAVTKTDPFSYTFAGVEWINVKWLFEILITFGKSIFGVEGIFIFQAGVVLGILTLLYKSANLLKKNISNTENSSPFAGLLLAALFLLFTIDYRMIGRPEMTSHLMTAAYLFLFWNYHFHPNKKTILALIPLQILWTNMHEAFGIGMVLMVAYLGATWVQYIYQSRQGKPVLLPKLLSIAVLGALLAIVINPRGYQMWLHPFNIFNQLSDNQYTTELASIWKADYWVEMHAYLNFVFFFVVIAFLIATPIIYRQLIEKTKTIEIPSKKKGKKGTTRVETIQEKAPVRWVDDLLDQYGLGNLLLVAMLFYLSTTAYRNIPFFVIAAAPIFAIALDFGIEKLKYPKWIYPATTLIAALFYITIITGKYHQWTNSRDQYGLQVLTSHNPVGAAKFIKENNITGKCFADYLTSSYLLWHLQPDFKTYIDLRDLDIFPTEFFSDFAQVASIPASFDAKDDSLNFDYVVLFRPQFQALQKHLLESPKYDLVFVDPVAAVYIKRTDSTSHLIDKYGFAKNSAPDIYTPLQTVEASSFAYLLSKIFNPLYQPTDYAEINQDALAGSYYMSLRNTELALARAKKAIAKGSELWKGYELYGNIYNFLAFSPTTADSLRSSYRNKALIAYDQAIEAKPDFVSAIVSKASITMQQGNFLNAINLLSEALDINPKDRVATQYMMICYKNLAFQNGQDVSNTKKWLEFALQLDELNPENPVILLDIGIAYCSLNKCKKATQYLNKIIGVKGLPVEEMKTAKKCLDKCSL